MNPERLPQEVRMHVFNLGHEQEWDPRKHVEKVLGRIEGGDVSVACWEPGQCSPNHCHPEATEVYFCFSGGGTMRTPARTVEVVPGSFVVHPSGELHEYENGRERTLLFRVRYGRDMRYHTVHWRGQPDWAQSAQDRAYFQAHPGTDHC
jgi:quercetin dioxygenase-like cupin family protein